MLVTILVIGLIITAIWFVQFDNKSDRSAKASEPEETNATVAEVADPVEDRTSYAFDLSVEQQIDEMLYFNPNENGYVIIAGEFEKQETTIEELRRRSDISKEQLLRLSQIELRNSRVMVERQMLAEIDSADSLKSFQNLAQSHLNGSDEVLKDLAAYSLAKIAATKLDFFTTEANSQQVVETFQNYKLSYLNDRRRSETLVNLLLKTRRENPEKLFVGACVHEMGKILVASDQKEIVEYGNQLGQYSFIQDFKLETLEDRIRYQATDALMELDKALRGLESNPDIELNGWQLVMRCYEASLSTKRIRDFNTAREIIGDLIKKLPDSDPKKAQLVVRLEQQQKRAEKLGTNFAVCGATVRERKIAPSSNEYSLLVFCDQKAPSAATMLALMESGSEAGNSFRPIICFKDPFNDDDMGRLDSIPTWAFIASEETAQQYIEAFAIDDFPYTFLIDKQGVVVEANLSIVQAKNRIAAIDKKEREAESESPALPTKSESR